MSSHNLRIEMCRLWNMYKAPDGRNKIVRAGYLMKKPTNNKLGGTKKRYFILLYRALLYYTDKVEDHEWNNEVPKGIIPLNENVDIQVSEGKNEFVLKSITEGSQKILLKAWGEGIDDTREWCNTISNLFNEVKSNLSIGANGEFSAHLDQNQMEENKHQITSIFGNASTYEMEGQEGLNEEDIEDEEDNYYGGDEFNDGKMLYGGNTFATGNNNTLMSEGSIGPTLQSTMTMGNTISVMNDDDLDNLYG